MSELSIVSDQIKTCFLSRYIFLKIGIELSNRQMTEFRGETSGRNYALLNSGFKGDSKQIAIAALFSSQAACNLNDLLVHGAIVSPISSRHLSERVSSDFSPMRSVASSSVQNRDQQPIAADIQEAGKVLKNSL